MVQVTATSVTQSKDPQKEADELLIKNAQKRWKMVVDNWSNIHRQAIMDQKFFAGEQYDEAKSRALAARGGQPQIQINQLPNFVQQVESSLRQQNFGICVHASDEKGSEDKAKILQGMVRHIEERSNAKQAYIWAAGSHGALVPGIGFIKLVTKYIDHKSFDQEILIEGIKDPFKILPDFTAIQPDFSDAKYWFEVEEYSKADYIEHFGESKLAKFADWGPLMQNNHLLRGENSVHVVTYWYKDTTVRHLARFEDGTVAYLDEYGVTIDKNGQRQIIDEEKYENYPRVSLEEEAEHLKAVDDKAPEGSPADQYPVTDKFVPGDRLAEIDAIRECVEEQVCWIITNGIEVLDRGEWNDSEFPFVAVCGQDQIVDGKRDIHGIVRYSKDPQKMYNYLTSQIIRKIDASNKSPWVADAKAMPSDKERVKWQTSNIDNHAILYFNSWDAEHNRAIPPPSRGDSVEPAIQAMLQASERINADIKKTVGIFDASLGIAAGDRQSGTAIQTLAEKGEHSNFHYADNFVMAMKRLGYLVIRLIPHIYDTARAVRIINPDDTAEVVLINQYFSEQGQQKIYDLSTEELYDVVVDMGPSYATKRSQQMEELLNFGGLNPSFIPVIADLIAQSSDWDTKDALFARIQAWQSIVMPQLHQMDQMPNLPPEARAAVMNLQGQLNTANQHVKALAGQVQSLEFEKKTNIIAHQSKERIEQMKSFTQLSSDRLKIIGEMSKSKDQLRIKALEAQLDHIQQTRSHIIGAIETDNAAKGMQNDHLLDLMKLSMQQPGTPAPANQPAAAAQPAANTPPG